MAGLQIDTWYLQMPPITRAFMTACVATTVFEFLGVVSIMDLYLNFSLVTERYELWRLITAFVYMGELGLPFILKMYFAIRYSRLLEEDQYRGRTADFVMLYVFGALSLLSLNAACHYYRFTSWKPPFFLGPALVNAILYVWAKRSPYIRMNFMGLFVFPVTYLPWVILGLELVMDNGSIVFDVLGILIGHLYHFATDVYPRTRGIHLLPTPSFFHVFVTVLTDNTFFTLLSDLQRAGKYYLINEIDLQHNLSPDAHKKAQIWVPVLLPWDFK